MERLSRVGISFWEEMPFPRLSKPSESLRRKEKEGITKGESLDDHFSQLHDEGERTKALDRSVILCRAKAKCRSGTEREKKVSFG